MAVVTVTPLLNLKFFLQKAVLFFRWLSPSPRNNLSVCAVYYTSARPGSINLSGFPAW